MSDQIIKVEKLTKNFGDITAVNKLAFSVAKGEMVGVAGAKRSGKNDNDSYAAWFNKTNLW